MSTDGPRSTLDRAAPYVVYRVARLMRFRLTHVLQDAGLDITPEQWFLLFRLWERDGQSQTELTDPSLRDRPNVTRLLDGLEKTRLIVRRRDERDRRRFRIELTPTARRAVDQIRPILANERREVFAGMSSSDVHRLTQDLQQVEANLQRLAAEVPATTR
jgi:DNA-binding MarR family transcriptional regulator